MSQKIIDTLKESYTRDLRKQVVKSVLKNEKTNDKEDLKSSYNILNQIFSYIMSELNWNISSSTNSWDDSPLKIMTEVFPRIETTQWYKNQELSVTKSINLESDFS
ncbi:hypothetical protein [Sulfurimonas sp.]|uniref:hypothetical protein n=1 Tax=Sulfurimonas sp. TaxID=2022749 RepID=UPI0025DCC7A7|nr:hypothetical protein [Sulfurimonas sp.]